MTARAPLSSICLVIAATAIAGCGTTPAPSASFASTDSPRSERRVVRSPIVADDHGYELAAPSRAKPVARAKKTTPVARETASVVDRPDPVKPVEPEVKAPEPEPTPPPKKEEPPVAPVSTTDSSGGSSGPGGGKTVVADAAPPPTSTTPPVADTPISPDTGAATPTPSDTLGAAIETPPTVSVEATSPQADGSGAKPFALPTTVAELRDIMNRPVAGFPLWAIAAAAVGLLLVLVLALRGRRKPRRQEPIIHEERRFDDGEEPQPA